MSVGTEVAIAPKRRSAPLVITDNHGQVVKTVARKPRSTATRNDPPAEIFGDSSGVYGYPKTWNEVAALEAYTSTVYAASDAIANRVARLVASNWIAAHAPNGSVTEIKVHPILDVLRCPSPIHSGSSLFKLTSLWLDLTGNAYWLIVRDPLGAVRGLWPLLPQLTKVVTGDGGFISGFNYYPDGFGTVGGHSIGFRPEDVIHFRLENPNEHVYGWSTLRAAAYEKNTADAIRVYESNWFKNQARPDYVISAGIPPGPKAQDDLERLWARIRIHHQGAKRFGLPLLLPKDSEVKHIQFSLADMQFLQLAQLTEDQILSIFKVPQFAVAKGQPFTTRASAVQASKEFAENAIEPRATLIWDTLNMRLINDPYSIPRPDGVRLELRHDPAAPRDEELSLDVAVRGFKSWLLTRDEARSEIGFGPAPVGGGEYAPVVQSAITPKPSVPMTTVQPDPSEPSQNVHPEQAGVAQPTKDVALPMGFAEAIHEMRATLAEIKAATTPALIVATQPVSRTAQVEDLDTKEGREAYFNRIIAPQDAQTIRATRIMRSFFRSQADRIAPQVRSYVEATSQKMAGWSRRKVFKSFDEWIRKADDQAEAFDRKKEEAALALVLLSLVRRAAQEGGDQFAAALSLAWDVESTPEVRAWVAEHASDQAAFITSTTARQVAQTVRDGVADGKSPEQVTSEVRSLFDDWTTPTGDEFWRSARVARTIVGTSFGYAHLSVLRDAWNRGLVKAKRWISREDEKVRDGSRGEATHRISGEKAAIPARFSNGMLCPGDTSTGNPADYMGERCVLGWVAA